MSFKKSLENSNNIAWNAPKTHKIDNGALNGQNPTKWTQSVQSGSKMNLKGVLERGSNTFI